MSLDALKSFVRSEMPILDAQIGPVKQADLRLVFNAATGLSIKGEETIPGSCVKYLQELNEMKARGTLNLSALPKALAQIAVILKEYENDHRGA